MEYHKEINQGEMKQAEMIQKQMMEKKATKEQLNVLNIKHRHFLHPSISHPVLRTWQGTNEFELNSNNLMYPIFVMDSYDVLQPIPSMPNTYRYGVGLLVKHLKQLIRIGLKSVLLFGVLETLSKDEKGTNADSDHNPVVIAIKLLRDAYPNLVIACDVCLCGYTSHGHCGILNNDNTIDNEASIQRIAEIATKYAKAGAHIVAPSDMMDGRVAAIKKSLVSNHLVHKVSILSYSAKFASTLYGPFRNAAGSAPSFGHRKCYQLPVGSSGIASRAISRDVAEGADMIMVKPGMPYLDIVKLSKRKYPEYPVFVYQVSGEYSMLSCAAEKGIINLEETLIELMLCMKRAGANGIVTYFTPFLLDLFAKKSCQHKL